MLNTVGYTMGQFFIALVKASLNREWKGKLT